MYTLQFQDPLYNAAPLLAELSAARVKVLLDYPRMAKSSVLSPKPRVWHLRAVGPELTMLGLSVRLQNVSFCEIGSCIVTAMVDRQWLDRNGFGELQFPVRPFITSVPAHNHGFVDSEEAFALYAWAMGTARFQLELRPDGTIAVRGSARVQLGQDVAHFRERHAICLSNVS